MPKLFFHLRGRKNVEYETDGASFKAIPYGWYTARFFNACSDANQALVKKMLGVEGPEFLLTLYNIALPLSLLVAALLTGRRQFAAEMITPPSGQEWDDIERFMASCFGLGKEKLSPETGAQAASKALAAYLGGESNPLQEQWLLTLPRPFLTRGGRVGWLCQCDTEARAAVAEMVLGFVHGWKPDFRLCPKCVRLYHGEECERCLPEKRERERLLGLLRVHKYRFLQEARGKREEVDKLTRDDVRQKKEEEVRCLEAAAREIQELQDKLRKGASVKGIVEDYLRVCKEYGLPTGWAKNY